jgi:hypothetical protein
MLYDLNESEVYAKRVVRLYNSAGAREAVRHLLFSVGSLLTLLS